VPKLEISHCRKKLIQEKTNFFAIGPVVFAPRTRTYATELKEWTVIHHTFGQCNGLLKTAKVKL
jgi:hypothetical protein